MVSFGLSVMPEPQFATAALPLFAEGLIDTIEWSFDMGWGPTGVPDWLESLLDDYAQAGELIGHGVSFSLFSGEWTPHHRGWLDRLRRETATRSYRHVSEHVGFVGAGRFSFAAPMPVPVCDQSVGLGAARLRMMHDAAGCPVGLENLATSFGPDDATQQGRLLAAVLEPVDGFVVLDLHNLWAQALNLGLDPLDIVTGYPLDRVREIHVSGGSWDHRGGSVVRRDTHDGDVPDEVVELVGTVAPRCPALETVVYERLGTALVDPQTHPPFRDDVRRLREVVTGL